MFFLSRRHIKKITAVLEEIAKGNLQQRIHVYSKGTLGRLAQAIDGVLSGLTSQINVLNKEAIKGKAILTSMVEGVIAIDKDARILSLNPTAEKIFTIRKQDAEGRLFLEVIRNNDISEIISRVLKSGEPLSSELNLILPVQKVFRINASAIFEDSAVAGCVLVIHDITQMRRLERVRSDFVANVSHELKTPLTSIKGFVETLLEGAIDDKKNNREFLRVIQEHTNRLENLINDLLDLASLEERGIALNTQEVNVRELADKVLAGFEGQLKKKEIEVGNELSGNLIIKADKDKIEQVWINFIDNAVKFNRPKGGIKIYAEETADNKIKFTVKDTGFGIPVKDIPRIFERFYRVDKARSRSLGGTGLGLSIVKHIIELHKGSVGVESVEGLGSEFSFILPK
ncbi:MAG: ATP-binding protein [Candidatus Omnitrophota bacterium]|nr:ATP-binding protein [Candidatus Omnitrophota bacterium]